MVEINKVGVGKYIVEVYPSDFISGTSELELSMSFLSGLGGDPYNRLRQGDLKKVTGLDNYKSTYDKNNKMTKASYFISVDESYINKVRFALSFRFNNEITTKGEYDA